MTARWWWVRHGPTHQKTFTGWRDVPADLSDTAAVARLNAALPTGAVVVSSDLQRCVATADAISSGRVRLPDTAQLREFDFGDWDGMGFEAVAARDPDLSRIFWESPGDLAAPNGESWNDVAKRIGAVVDALTEANEGRDIIAVAHLGVILTQIQRAEGDTAARALRHQIDPLSVTSLHQGATGWSVQRINHRP